MSTDAGFQVTLYFGVKIDFLLDLSEALDGMSELRDCHPSEGAIKGIYELIKKVPTIKGIIMVECNIVIGKLSNKTKQSCGLTIQRIVARK